MARARHGHAVIRALIIGVAVAASMAIARPAAAHPMDVGYLRIDIDDRAAKVVLDIDVNLAALLLGTDAHAMDEVTLRTRTEDLATATYRVAPITSGSAACAWAGVTTELRGRTISLSDRADCPSAIRTLRWPLPFATRAQSTFKLLVKTRGAGAEQAAIVDHDRPFLEVVGPEVTSGFGDFVLAGVSHIGALPSEWKTADGSFKLADGIDHILFVLALLLAGGSIRQLVGVVTGFTVGHSITLALSALDVVRPPAALIEPLIALSIAIVAAEALSGKLPKHRWRVAAVLGLVHGFGFARGLQSFDLSKVNAGVALLGYNLGVELGQLVIILLVAPLILLAHRHAYSKMFVGKIAPALILAAGLWWFVERVFVSPPT